MGRVTAVPIFRKRNKLFQASLMDCFDCNESMFIFSCCIRVHKERLRERFNADGIGLLSLNLGDLPEG